MVRAAELGDHVSSGGTHRNIGDYRLLFEVARAPMGALWLASPNLEQRHLVLLRELSFEGEELAALLDELGRDAPAHDGALPRIAVARDGDVVGVVHQYVSGDSLRTLQRNLQLKRRALSEALVNGSVARIARVLGGCAGRVRGGPCPDSILISSDGRPLLIDGALTGRLARTEDNELLGYRSPEELGDPEASDERSEVFTLGLIAYELVTGRRLFSGANRAAIERKVISADGMERLDKIRPLDRRTSEATADVIAAALSVDPDERPSSLLELADALEQAAPQPFEESALAEVYAEVAGAAARSREAMLKRVLGGSIAPAPAQPAVAGSPPAAEPTQPSEPEPPKLRAPAPPKPRSAAPSKPRSALPEPPPRPSPTAAPGYEPALDPSPRTSARPPPPRGKRLRPPPKGAAAGRPKPPPPRQAAHADVDEIEAVELDDADFAPDVVSEPASDDDDDDVDAGWGSEPPPPDSAAAAPARSSEPPTTPGANVGFELPGAADTEEKTQSAGKEPSSDTDSQALCGSPAAVALGEEWGPGTPAPGAISPPPNAVITTKPDSGRDSGFDIDLSEEPPESAPPSGRQTVPPPREARSLAEYSGDEAPSTSPGTHRWAHEAPTAPGAAESAGEAEPADVDADSAEPGGEARPAEVDAASAPSEGGAESAEADADIARAAEADGDRERTEPEAADGDGDDGSGTHHADGSAAEAAVAAEPNAVAAAVPGPPPASANAAVPQIADAAADARGDALAPARVVAGTAVDDEPRVSDDVMVTAIEQRRDRARKVVISVVAGCGGLLIIGAILSAALGDDEADAPSAASAAGEPAKTSAPATPEPAEPTPEATATAEASDPEEDAGSKSADEPEDETAKKPEKPAVTRPLRPRPAAPRSKPKFTPSGI